jgi:hypothetical protein
MLKIGIIIVLAFVVILVGCSSCSNTPTNNSPNKNRTEIPTIGQNNNIPPAGMPVISNQTAPAPQTIQYSEVPPTQVVPATTQGVYVDPNYYNASCQPTSPIVIETTKYIVIERPSNPVPWTPIYTDPYPVPMPTPYPVPYPVPSPVPPNPAPRPEPHIRDLPHDHNDIHNSHHLPNPHDRLPGPIPPKRDELTINPIVPPHPIIPVHPAIAPIPHTPPAPPISVSDHNNHHIH